MSSNRRGSSNPGGAAGSSSNAFNGQQNNGGTLPTLNEDEENENDVDSENDNDLPPYREQDPYQPNAAASQNNRGNNNGNRRGSPLPDQIRNPINRNQAPANAVNQEPDQISVGSDRSIDSLTKESMLRTNRERDGNGMFQASRSKAMLDPYSFDFVRTRSMQKLSRRFIEDHSVELTHIPFYWNVTQASTFFGLKLKMCQIQKIVYDFQFGSPTGQPMIPSLPSLVEQPNKCLKVDFSLNDLQDLPVEALEPFPNLRHLDASLNRIESYQGIEVCSELVYLNLSHNFIRQLAHLSGLKNLSELNLSMNDIRDISMMPSLSNLTIVHLNNNRLTTLDGIQALARLNELHVQKNKLTNIQPLASSFTLRVLNASDNNLLSLHDTLVVLQALSTIQYLFLHDNPIYLERGYANAIKQLTTTQVLDNVPLYPDAAAIGPQQLGGLPMLNNKQYDNLGGIRYATEHVFQQQIENHKRKTMNYINQLQRRIRELQEDSANYESRLKRDLNEVLKYYDTFQYDVSYVGQGPREAPDPGYLTPGEKPWAGISLSHRRQHDRRRRGGPENDMDANLFTRKRQMEDRKKLRDPSKILQLAAQDLNIESNNRMDRNSSIQNTNGSRNQNATRQTGPPNATREEFMDF